MTTTPWLQTLLSAAATASLRGEKLDFRLALVSPEERWTIDLATARLAQPQAAAACTLEGSADLFEDLVAGRVTLQKAFVTGRLQMQGDAEGLLRLYGLFDACTDQV